MYPALAGRFLSTMPTEKSKEFFFFFFERFYPLSDTLDSYLKIFVVDHF